MNCRISEQEEDWKTWIFEGYTSLKQDKQKSTPKHITVKMKNAKEKVKIIKIPREKM
jgi:hypothetical protein